MTAKIIAIANQKGGVTKTTTTVNLGHWLAMQGLKVGIVDLDGQGHVATLLGYPKSDGLYRFVVQGRTWNEVALPARENLSIVQNDHTGETVKQFVTQANFREYLLGKLLEEARELHDVILLDTPPGTDVLHVLALVASDLLIIPAKMDYLALDGVSDVLTTLKSIGSFPGVVAPTLIGILPTLYDKTTGATRNAIAQLQNWSPSGVLPPIPADTRCREAASLGKTIWEYAPDSRAAIGFETAADYVGNGKNSKGCIGGYLHLGEIVLDVIGS